MTTPEANKPTRRAFLNTVGDVLKTVALGEVAQIAKNTAPTTGILTTAATLIFNARDARVISAAEQACGPLDSDGRDPICVTTDTDLYGQSQFGGFYFIDRNGNGKYEPEAGDEAMQGVRGRQLLVEEFRFEGWGDVLQANPRSRTVYSDGRVSYEDVKAGKNSGERFIDRWTVFQIPEDPIKNIGIGYDLRTGSDRLLIAVKAGSLVDKVWSPIDDGKRYDRHECSGNCGWNCIKFVQISRLEAGVIVDLNKVIENGQIHDKKDPNSGLWIPSSITDGIWLWRNRNLSDNHVDFNRISTPLTEELRKSEGVVKSTVLIPRNTVSYDNYSR